MCLDHKGIPASWDVIHRIVQTSFNLVSILRFPSDPLLASEFQALKLSIEIKQRSLATAIGSSDHNSWVEIHTLFEDNIWSLGEVRLRRHPLPSRRTLFEAKIRAFTISRFVSSLLKAQFVPSVIGGRQLQLFRRNLRELARGHAHLGDKCRSK